MLKNILSFGHYVLQESLSKGETAVDATAGRGNDTLFLSRIVGAAGRVIALDIQKEAIRATRLRAEKESRHNVTLFHCDHSIIGTLLEGEKIEQIGGAVFNLGYLPGGSKDIITKPCSTIKALSSLLKRLKAGGVIVLNIYSGHKGGEDEKKAVLHFCEELDQKSFHVLKYDFINQKNNPPFLLVIEKR